MGNLFEEIDKEKEELPKIDSITKEVVNHKLNSYQIVAVVTFIISFIGGVILGNLFPACESTGMFSSCIKTQFNLSLTIFVWFASFLVCLFFYALGHIIELLGEINKKLGKKK